MYWFYSRDIQQSNLNISWCNHMDSILIKGFKETEIKIYMDNELIALSSKKLFLKGPCCGQFSCFTIGFLWKEIEAVAYC